MDDSLAPPRGIIFNIITVNHFFSQKIATINNIIKETLNGVKFSNQYTDLVMESSKGIL